MKTIIEMSREANLPACHTTHPKALERFADLVRADERDACVKLVREKTLDGLPKEMPDGEELQLAFRQIGLGVVIEYAIRERGNS